MCGFLIFLIISISRVYSTGVDYQIGSNKFAEVVQSLVFVDKTMMIKDFFHHKRVLITAPHRFGKTINMDMVREFCELKVFPNGTRIPKNKRDSYKLFTQNNLKIYDPTLHSFFNKHFGEYPVLYLDFSDLSGKSFSQFFKSFKLMVRKQFHLYGYLLKSDFLNEDERKQDFNEFYIKRKILNLDDLDMVGSLNFLTKTLHGYFKKEVIVLIDEFDVPIQRAIFEAGKDTGKITAFIREFVRTLLKTNPYVERALINACVRLSGVFTSSADNIQVYRFTENHPFNLYYGFTFAEVKQLARKCRTGRLKRIRERYDGYSVANSKIKLYNVWSIVKYMYSKQCDNYWAEPDYSFNLEYLCFHFTIFKHFILLLLNNQAEILVIEKTSIEHIEYLKTLILNPTNTTVKVNDVYLFLNLMIDLGYFTIAKTYKTDYCKYCSITIPNNEIRDEIKRNLFLLELLTLKYISDSFRNRYLESILNLGDESSSYETFLKYVHTLFKKFNIPENEVEFQGILSIIPYAYGFRYSIEIQSQIKPAISNFNDFFIYNRDNGTGIVIGVKYNRDEYCDGLEEIVLEKRYFDVLDNYNVQTRIFMCVYYNENGKYNIDYLFNNTDINNRINVLLIK